MPRVSWTKGEGPLVAFVDGLRDDLTRRGYTRNGVRPQLALMGQLNRWLAREGRGVGELTPALAERFLSEQRRSGRRRVPTLRSLAPLFGYLRGQQVLPAETSAEGTALDELIARYRRHLIGDRDLAPTTVLRYERMARRFLARRASERGGEIGAEGLGADEVRTYLRECSAHLVITSTKREAADLRALLRFLYRDGLAAIDLGVAIPPVAGWRDTRLPATLDAADVGTVLASCDRSTATGRRDFTVLILLARLGLRAGEVVALQLSDIDWQAGEIVVHGKARRVERLPLTVDVGEAIAGYLREGRPHCDSRRLILTRQAPFRAIHPSSITTLVYRACRRAGLAPVGAHRLRHALASEMLRRGGNLLEISQVLRHRDLATTFLYAKVDHEALRAVAGAWPGAAR